MPVKSRREALRAAGQLERGCACSGTRCARCVVHRHDVGVHRADDANLCAEPDVAALLRLLLLGDAQHGLGFECGCPAWHGGGWVAAEG